MDVISVVEKLGELNIIRPSRIIGNYYQIYCPIHNDGNERNPSCGILLHDEVRNGQKYPEGLVHCFSCQYAKPLHEMVTDVLKAKHISNKSGLDWLSENVPGFEVSEFDYLLPQNLMQSLNSQFAVSYIASKTIESAKYIDPKELENYRYTIDYMYDRKLTDDVISKFDVGVDLEFIPPGAKRKVPCITFPVKDETGNVLFIYRRSIQGKKFFMPQGLDKPVYGLYELDKNSKSVIICESIFNALTCYVYGYPAIALFGTGTTEQIKKLRQLGVYEFILGLDPDEAGVRSANKLKNALMDVAIVSRMRDIPEGKDINDLTKEEFDVILNERY